jgi:nucleotide-binding universal stress UspA family protein
MLVVGTRGYGSMRTLMLGSVAQHLSHYAGLPVVIVTVTRIPDRT